jgi:hypothetical protein
MCKEDCESSDTQVIKDVDEALTRDEVVSVVDGLLSDGSRILESERALDTA